MTMKKYTSPEKIEVFYGEEAVVVNRHLKRTGKAISDFSADELKALQTDLEKARETGMDDVSHTSFAEDFADEK